MQKLCLSFLFAGAFLAQATTLSLKNNFPERVKLNRVTVKTQADTLIDMDDYTGEFSAFISYAGYYLTAQSSTTTQLLGGQANNIYTEFYLNENSDGTYTLKSQYGWYLRGQTDSKVYQSTTISTNEKWLFTYGGADGRVCLKNQATATYLYLNSKDLKYYLGSSCSTSYHKFKVATRSYNSYLQQLSDLQVAFKSSWGTYLRAPMTASDKMNQQTFIDKWEKFYFELNDDGSYSLLTYHGAYVKDTAQGLGGEIIQNPYIGHLEKWEFVYLGDYTFCIRSNYYKNYISANGTTSADTSRVSFSSSCGTKEKWELIILSDVSYVEIEYDINEYELIELEPLVVATQVLDNTDTSEDQTMQFSFSKTLSQSNSFEHSHGFEVAVSVTTSAKIPFIGESEVSVSASTSSDWTYGSENSEETTFQVDSPVTVPGGSVYKCTATVKQSKLDIPYTGIVHFEDTTATKTISGIYHGVAYFNMYTNVKDVTS